jgi:hypothetical protein
LSFLQKSPAYQRFLENYYESDDPLYNGLRAVGSRLGRLFDENEQAKVIRAIRETDPHFKMDRFQTELKEYIVPEVIDAFLSADRADMRAWMSEAAFNVSWAVLGEYIKSGLVSASQVIEVSSVDVLQAKFHNETVPVFLVTCESQEVHAWKSAKTGEVKVGDARSVKRSRYVFALTMVESELENELTSGWKVVEVGLKAHDPSCLADSSSCEGRCRRAVGLIVYVRLSKVAPPSRHLASMHHHHSHEQDQRDEFKRLTLSPFCSLLITARSTLPPSHAAQLIAYVDPQRFLSAVKAV